MREIGTFVAFVCAIALGEYLGFKLSWLEKWVVGAVRRHQLRQRYQEYERKVYVAMEESLASAPDKFKERGLTPADQVRAMELLEKELKRDVDNDLHAYRHAARMPCGRMD